METSSILLLVISGAISFGLGRTYVHFRDKKRQNELRARQAQALRDRPAEVDSRNKSKRKRQLSKENASRKH
jgi:hypothetical protein